MLDRIIAQAPLPASKRLAWQRSRFERAYAKLFVAAKAAKDLDQLRSLEADHHFESGLHDEEEDALLTGRLLASARRLRVPVPRLNASDGTPSPDWYQGSQTGRWYLTNPGITALRGEIRREQRARHEARSHWVVWTSSITGLIGALTGLVALLLHAM